MATWVVTHGVTGGAYEGFKVMLWVCPFVSADSVDFRHLAEKGMLLLDPHITQEILWANTRNKAAVIRWWNGASACLDLSNPKAMKWFQDRLDYLAREASETGEPIAKPMAMAFPDGGYETIKNQFVLGNNIIVAPVVEKGARSRIVVLPKGEWKAEDGAIHTGGVPVKIEAPLQRLPYFVRK